MDSQTTTTHSRSDTDPIVMNWNYDDEEDDHALERQRDIEGARRQLPWMKCSRQ